ncbi:MAG: Lrp/AsnC family transcriptional regulator [Methyloprofundus sp.]|nr:Lrp/AsnC family transcriptional regulator [Methyloprofundus sp.]MBW6453491.1 Lrp/AsnC family transcriptional regulator [Methyloprofundus sp.]
MLSSLHKQLLNDYQQDFPLSPTPYLDIANTLGVSEEQVLAAFSALSEQDFISRIGPIIQPNQLGISTLVAMAIPKAQLSKIADRVNQFPEVNHNYEREHHFNLWFVLIARDQQHLSNVIAQIERQTGFKTMQLPLLEDYFINLGFQLDLEPQTEVPLGSV